MTPNANSPATIATAQTLEGVLAQVAVNQIDLPVAVKANQDAPTEAQQNLFEANALLSIDSAAQATVAAGAVDVSTSSSAKTAATAKAGKKGNKGARAFIA